MNPLALDLLQWIFRLLNLVGLVGIGWLIFDKYRDKYRNK